MLAFLKTVDPEAQCAGRDDEWYRPVVDKLESSGYVRPADLVGGCKKKLNPQQPILGGGHDAFVDRAFRLADATLCRPEVRLFHPLISLQPRLCVLVDERW